MNKNLKYYLFTYHPYSYEATKNSSMNILQLKEAMPDVTMLKQVNYMKVSISKY